MFVVNRDPTRADRYRPADATASPTIDIHEGPKIIRRSVLNSMARAAACLPFARCRVGRAEPADAAASSPLKKSPSWYGFNLLEYFSTDPDWMKYFPYKNDGVFLEGDFRWIRDWGFNFVRLPMDYRFWTASDNRAQIDEQKVAAIDRAIRLGEKYGIHVNLCLHRAPGFCILDDMDAALTGIHVTPEKASLFDDPHTLEAFVDQWRFFTRRYQGIPNERVSFNLVNEPLLRPTPGEKQRIPEQLKDKPEAVVNQAIESHGKVRYARIVRTAIDGIRAVDPGRLIVVDGFEVSKTPVEELCDTDVIQSPHTYYPPEVTTYKGEWARQWLKRAEPPTWPLKDKSGRIIADRRSIDTYLEPWRDVVQRGIPIHFGEFGCYKHTPPEVTLAWFDDTLDAISELKSGWALWNFRGPFGILDSQRPGTKYQDWHGHQLDRSLLELLQRKMKT